MRITIFGRGNMGAAIAGVFASGGADIEHVGEGNSEAVINGEIVVLAVPYAALNQIVSDYGEKLAGRVVVDITNPVNFDTFDSLVVPSDSSAAAALAAKLPDSRVLKAFNTTFAGTLAAKRVGERQTTVLIAGDDQGAKGQLAAAITAGGVGAIDVGPLARARELEALGFLQISLAASEKIPWTGGFAVVR